MTSMSKTSKYIDTSLPVEQPLWNSLNWLVYDFSFCADKQNNHHYKIGHSVSGGEAPVPKSLYIYI